MPINYTSYTQLAFEPSIKKCTIYSKIWPTTSQEAINTGFHSQKEPIKPYFVVDGVVINDNKGSRTAFLYLSLKSIKVVKTYALGAIKCIHSKLFT